MKRRLFSLAAAASLVLCMFVCAHWIRSLYVVDLVERVGRAIASFEFADGLIAATWSEESEASRRVYARNIELDLKLKQIQLKRVEVLFRDGKAGSSEVELAKNRVIAAETDAERVRRSVEPGWHFVRWKRGNNEYSRWQYLGNGWRRLGFQHISGRLRDGSVAHQFSLPHYAIAMVAAFLPAMWVLRQFRSRRRRLGGLCSVCGYDLRASPERCPECGTKANRQSAAGAAA